MFVALRVDAAGLRKRNVLRFYRSVSNKFVFQVSAADDEHSVLSWVMLIEDSTAMFHFVVPCQVGPVPALAVKPSSSNGSSWSLWSGLNVFRKPCASCSFSFPHSVMSWGVFLERIPQPCSGCGAPCQLGSQASMLFEMFPQPCTCYSSSCQSVLHTSLPALDQFV